MIVSELQGQVGRRSLVSGSEGMRRTPEREAIEGVSYLLGELEGG